MSHIPASHKPRDSAPSNGRVIVSHDPFLSREAALAGWDAAWIHPQVTGEVQKLLGIFSAGLLGRMELQSALKLRSQANFRERYLMPALASDLIERAIPEKPNSRLQKYRLTEKGRVLAAKIVSQ